MSGEAKVSLERWLFDVPIFLGLTGPMMLLASFVMLRVTPSVIPLLLAFTVPFSVYLLNRVSDLDEDSVSSPERASFFERHKMKVMVVVALLQFVSISVAFLFGRFFGVVTLLPILISVLYSMGPSRLKEIFFVKNATIGVLWGGFIAFLPAAWNESVSLAVLPVCLFFTLKAGADSILADVKDMRADAEQGISTVPQRLGIQNTRYMLYMVNTIAYLILLVSVYVGFFPKTSLLIAAIYPYSMAISYMTGTVDPQRHADLYADIEFYLIGFVAGVILL